MEPVLGIGSLESWLTYVSHSQSIVISTSTGVLHSCPFSRDSRKRVGVEADKAKHVLRATSRQRGYRRVQVGRLQFLGVTYLPWLRGVFLLHGPLMR